MNPVNILRIGLALARVPFLLLWVLCMRASNFVAPDWTFKIMKRMLYKKGIKMDGITFERASDLAFLFSIDLVTQNTKVTIKDILKEA